MEQNHPLRIHAEKLVGAGLEYAAEFVPFSKSRNAKKATKPGDLSLNWKVTLKRGGRSITTDYMQGVAHVPGYTQNTRWTADAWDALRYACENGKTIRRPGSAIPQTTAIPAPALADILYCLVSDAGALDCPTYEEWAADLGYDKDSRAGERIYRKCVRLGLELRAMLGEDGLAALRDASQDY